MRLLFCFFVLISVHLTSQAQKEIQGCGISMRGKKKASIELSEIGKICSSKVYLETGLPILEDSQTLTVESISLEEKIKKNEFFSRENNRIVLNVSFDLDESQYRIETLVSSMQKVEVFGRSEIAASLKLRVVANPYKLWPKNSDRKKSLKKFAVNKSGLIVDCIYSYVALNGKTVAFSGCIPRSSDPMDLSAGDLKKMVRSIRLDN